MEKVLLVLIMERQTPIVFLVEGIKHNLLSVRKMCDLGYKLTFDSKGCEIRKEDSSLITEKCNQNLKKCIHGQRNQRRKMLYGTNS